MNKILKIILICLLFILVIAFSFGLFFLLKTNFSFGDYKLFSFNINNNLVEEKEIEDIKNLEVEFNSCDLNIKDSNDDKILIQIYSEDSSEHEIVINDELVKVKLNEKNSFHFFSKSSRIVIYLPKVFNKNIVVNGSAGDIHLGNFNEANSKIILNAGDIHIDSLNSLDLNLDSGDIHVDNINDLVSDMRAGDLRVHNINNYIKLKQNAGDIKISNLNIKKNSSIDVSTGSVKISKTNDIYLDCSANIGDTKIGKNNRRSDIELVVRVNIGDIKINY